MRCTSCGVMGVCLQCMARTQSDRSRGAAACLLSSYREYLFALAWFQIGDSRRIARTKKEAGNTSMRAMTQRCSVKYSALSRGWRGSNFELNASCNTRPENRAPDAADGDQKYWGARKTRPKKGRSARCPGVTVSIFIKAATPRGSSAQPRQRPALRAAVPTASSRRSHNHPVP